MAVPAPQYWDARLRFRVAKVGGVALVYPDLPQRTQLLLSFLSALATSSLLYCLLRAQPDQGETCQRERLPGNSGRLKETGALGQHRGWGGHGHGRHLLQAGPSETPGMPLASGPGQRPRGKARRKPAGPSAVETTGSWSSQGGTAGALSAGGRRGRLPVSQEKQGLPIHLQDGTPVSRLRSRRNRTRASSNFEGSQGHRAQDPRAPTGSESVPLRLSATRFRTTRKERSEVAGADGEVGGRSDGESQGDTSEVAAGRSRSAATRGRGTSFSLPQERDEAVPAAKRRAHQDALQDSAATQRAPRVAKRGADGGGAGTRGLRLVTRASKLSKRPRAKMVEAEEGGMGAYAKLEPPVQDAGSSDHPVTSTPELRASALRPLRTRAQGLRSSSPRAGAGAHAEGVAHSGPGHRPAALGLERQEGRESSLGESSERTEGVARRAGQGQEEGEEANGEGSGKEQGEKEEEVEEEAVAEQEEEEDWDAVVALFLGKVHEEKMGRSGQLQKRPQGAPLEEGMQAEEGDAGTSTMEEGREGGPGGVSSEATGEEGKGKDKGEGEVAQAPAPVGGEVALPLPPLSVVDLWEGSPLRANFEWKLSAQLMQENEDMYQEGVATQRASAGRLSLMSRILDPLYSCPLEERFGAWGEGGKWLCLLPHLTNGDKTPVVYSIGCLGETSFEYDVFSLLGARAYTYDHTLKPHVRPAVEGLSYLNFIPRGLTGAEGAPGDGQEPDAADGLLLTLEEMMRRNGHSAVDVFKIDCEGCEIEFVQWLRRHTTRATPILGQILVEIHHLDTAPQLDLALVESLEQLGYRNFRSEQNVFCTTCYEIAFIHETLVQPPQYMSH